MSLFDLSFVLASLSNEVASVSRPTPGGYDSNGRAIANTFTEIANAIKIPFQPIETDLTRAPEAFTDSAKFWAWSTVPLKNLDRITILGGELAGVYEVESVEPWGSAGNYSKARVRQLDPSES